MSEKIDLKKTLKALYQVSDKAPAVVEVPPQRYLMVDGEGDPNTAPAYAEAIETLFSVSYTAKFMVKKGPQAIDYGVMPLESLWWSHDLSAFRTGAKDRWKWTAMILQPDFVSDGLIGEAVDEVRRAIADELVTIEVLQPSEPSPVSPADGAAWDDLVASIHEVHPGLLVSPYVMMQASDSRFMTTISDHTYRFTPFRLSAAERACLHAKNEHIRVSAFLEGVRSYEALLRRR